MKLNSIIFIFLLSMISTEAVSAEWKFTGRFEGPNKQAATSYYDAQSVDYSPNGIVKVWIESINDKEKDEQFMNNKKSILDNAAEMYASGYLPPYLLIKKEI